jgi:hypothetical protein
MNHPVNAFTERGELIAECVKNKTALCQTAIAGIFSVKCVIYRVPCKHLVVYQMSVQSQLPRVALTKLCAECITSFGIDILVLLDSFR